MIIDFHTHIFPEKVARKALPKLSSVIHLDPATDGTIEGLLASMREAGIAVSVVMPTVTDPHQFDSILRFACLVNEYDYGQDGPRLISFGGIHPDSSDYKEQLQLLKDHGFAGFKIHPDYQLTCFNDIRYKRILYRAAELELCCLTHCGYDPYSPDKVHCTPQMILDVIKEVSPYHLVLAHMGSNNNYDESEAMLMGQPVYLDMAYSLLHMDRKQLVRMIRAHGTDKVLFGSDSPWTSQKEDVEVFRSLGSLTDLEKEQIFSGNARKLLGI
ncbi:MAG TPA: amidohydrolase family protein [Candidatus Blautia gallistercoris]|uniref:Amidohydrolase family protein n=1 Tax=Candidatus Blautia gallistercoris TaxID=2838490 RepID=A0A9D1WID5_9FIRM|nr:amidohydrolase family protein [Candidatus Blautia gallistercoris]